MEKLCAARPAAVGRRYFLGVLGAAAAASVLPAPPGRMFVGVTPGFNAAMKANAGIVVPVRKVMARIRISKEAILASVHTPGAFAAAAGNEWQAWLEKAGLEEWRSPNDGALLIDVKKKEA